MNWYHFESRFPSAFKTFCEWYKSAYPAEYQDCNHPVYTSERLLEFFETSKVNVKIEPKEAQSHLWRVFVGGRDMNSTHSEDTALQVGVYHAFEMIEKKHHSNGRGPSSLTPDEMHKGGNTSSYQVK